MLRTQYARPKKHLTSLKGGERITGYQYITVHRTIQSWKELVKDFTRGFSTSRRDDDDLYTQETKLNSNADILYRLTHPMKKWKNGKKKTSEG